MSEYRAPIRDMMFVLEELAGIDGVSKLPGFDEVNRDLVEQILVNPLRQQRQSSRLQEKAMVVSRDI